MTMRMQSVPEEPGRRDQTLDLGAEAVVALYRLARTAQMHDPSNQSYFRQIEQTQQAVVDYCSRAGRFLSVFFTPVAIFVGGELLRGPRATQEFAAELGSLLEARRISELVITKDVSPEDLLELSRLMAPTPPPTPFANPRIRVRAVDDLVRARGLTVEHLPIDRRIARTYGEAVVAVRRLFDELLAGRYVLPARIKRIAQRLVELAAAQNPFFVGVTEAKSPSPDEAVVAVHAAFLAAAMARELGADRPKSVEIVLAALLHDVALPRIRSRAVEQTGRTGEAPEADAELPPGTAATLGAFSGLHENSMPRAVVAFESQWSRFAGPLGAVYKGARPPTLQSRIVHIAHSWARIRLAMGLSKPRTLDDVVATVLEDVREPGDFAVVRLLVSTLRFYPVGTVVELDSHEIAEVVRSGDAGHGLPVVRLTTTSAGAALESPVEVDLGEERRRSIVRVRSVEGWRRLERAAPPSVPRPTPRPQEAAAVRGSLPSISPGLLDGLSTATESEDFIQVLRTELNQQLAEVFPQEKSAPSLDDAAAKAMARPESTGASSPASIASKSRSSQRTPSARGALATTPLVHVLIYLLDHGITGSVELVEPEGTAHLIYVRKGAPVKVKTGRLVSPVAELLAQSGKLPTERIPELVAAANADGVLLGEHLIAQGLISRGQLWASLELQIPLKLERLANLSPETKYALYKDVNLLERWGGADAVAADPIHVIHCVVRRWNDRERIRSTLSRIGKHPLIVRDDAKIGGLKLTPEEGVVLEAIRGHRATLGVLSHMRVADLETLSSLVYTLAITRQLELPSQKKDLPMGLRAASLPPPPGRHTAPPSSGAPRPSETAVPRIANAIATALSSAPGPMSATNEAAPTSSVSSSGAVAAAAPPGAPGPASAQPSSPLPPAHLGGSVASPLSSTGFPPVSSSRERMVGSAGGVGLGGAPPSSASPASVTAGAGRPPAPSEALDAADRALEAMSFFRRAETALLKGDSSTAEKLVEHAIALDSEPVEYRALLAWLRAQTMATDQLPAVVGAMTDLLVEHPDHSRVLLYRARLLKRQGRVREAVADYEAHLRASPKNKQAIAELKALRGS